EQDLHLPAEQIGKRGYAAAIGHVQHVDASHHLEQLARDMCAASNMVTVMRPSRARCVKGTIPRHERTVPNSAAPGAGGAHASTGCDRAPPGSRLWLDFKRLFSAAPLHFLSDLRDDVWARGFL